MKRFLSLLVIFVLVFSISVGFASETEKLLVIDYCVRSWGVIITKLYGEPYQIKTQEDYDSTYPMGEIIYTFDILTLVYDGQSKSWIIPRDELTQLKDVMTRLLNNMPFTDAFALMRFMEKL